MKILLTTLSILSLACPIVSCSKDNNEKKLPVSEDLDTSTDEETKSERITEEWADAVNGEWKATECLNFERGESTLSLNSSIILDLDAEVGNPMSITVNEFNGADCNTDDLISVYSGGKMGFVYEIMRDDFIDYEPMFYDSELKEIGTTITHSRSGKVPRMNIFIDKIIQTHDYSFKGLEHEYKLKFTFKKT